MTQPNPQPTPDQWRAFFRDCAARPVSAGARMRNETENAWRLRGERCELCGVALARGELSVSPFIPAALGGHAGFGNGMNCCPACAAAARHTDALPLIEAAPQEFRERLMERREAALAGSLNEEIPAGLNRAGREEVLARRWAYPRTVVHIDAGAGLLGFQRAFTPDPLLGALVMVVRTTRTVLGQMQERRWAGLHVAPGDVGAVACALVERNAVIVKGAGSSCKVVPVKQGNHQRCCTSSGPLPSAML